jgi:hypothetical protein
MSKRFIVAKGKEPPQDVNVTVPVAEDSPPPTYAHNPYTNMYEEAINATDQKRADCYFNALVSYLMARTGQSGPSAVQQVQNDLGYYAGYFTQAVRLRVEKLYGARHPYLGTAEKNLTPEEIYQIGFDLGSKFKKKENKP